MFNINFIGPGEGSDSEKLSEKPWLPKPYCQENPISKHLTESCFWTALELSALEHVNPLTGELFQNISYYTEGQSSLAVSSKEDFGYVTTMSMPFVRRLVKICHLLTPALNYRPRANNTEESHKHQNRPKLERNDYLNSILEGETQVSESEAIEIVTDWTSGKSGGDIELGSYALFYDMIRLIWVHEWAHCLCGHVELASSGLGFTTFDEFSYERAAVENKNSNYSSTEILQAIEIHADEFAAKQCLRDILWGTDPVVGLAGGKVDLVDRLLIFNVACCLFTVIWSLSEKKYAPDDTFYPPSQLESNESRPTFVTTKSTHPPGVLRYEHFREYEREIATGYGIEVGRPEFNLVVDAYSFGFLETLGELSSYFYSLQTVTPLIARTPTKKILQAYSDFLVGVSMSLAPQLMKLYYLPTDLVGIDNEE